MPERKLNQSPQEGIHKPGKLREIVNFVKSSPFPQSYATLNLAVASGIGYYTPEIATKEGIGTVIGLNLLNLALLVRHEKMAAKQYSNYRRLRNRFASDGWNARFIGPLEKDLCGRNTARVAAVDTGYKKEIKHYFKTKGYKWYHIFAK